MKAICLLFVVAVSVTMTACGSSGGSGADASGIPQSTTLSSLTPAQAGVLCDWENAKQGGYGRSVSCPDGGMQTTDTDRASCVSAAQPIGADCPTLTVGDVEDCANAIGTDLCSLATQPACAAFNACVSSLQ
jgi:hypothetical protein